MVSFEVRSFTTSCPGDLLDEINSNVNISKTCIEIAPKGKKTTFVFESKLSSSEKLELDLILSTWQCPNYVGVNTLTGVDSIISEPMAFAYDAVRQKNLSTETTTLVFSEAQLTHMDWIQVGAADDADSGIVMPYDGTFVRSTGHCENVNNANMQIQLYINTLLSVNSILTFTGSGEKSLSNLTMNVDFNAGDKIRLRSFAVSGSKIDDTIITLWAKWRKV